jgi:hypothetical protein
MLFALGAVSGALDALQSLTSAKTSSAQQTGAVQGGTNPFSIDSVSSTTLGASSSVNPSNCPQISPQTMSALIAAQSRSSASTSSSSSSTSAGSTSSSSTSMSPQDALKDLFSQIDADGDGSITKSEFENALGAGGANVAQADDVFSKLDTNGDGSVSLDEISKALTGGHHGHHHAESTRSSSGSGDAGGSGSGGSCDPLTGATSTFVTISDGSTTTTVTYAGGSKVSMTTPAVSSSSSSGSNSGGSNSATWSYNLIEQMIQREAQQLSVSAASSVSVSV